MNKAQKLNEFWNSFNVPAYDATSVPSNVEFPYISFSVSEDSIENIVSLDASIWYKSYSWAEIENKTNEIAKRLGEYGHLILTIDDGYIFLAKGTPFAQRMSDPNDDTIRRMYINIMAEYLTAY